MTKDNVHADEVRDPLLEEYAYPTMFGKAEVFTLQTEDDTPVRVLYVDGGFQSATYLGEDRFQPVFAYYRAIDFVFQLGRPIHRMLMIGGGGFSYPKYMLMNENSLHQDARMDVVEIDPAIVDIARRHFFLDEVEWLHGPFGTGRLGIIVADGTQVLRASASDAYNVVVNDSFDGTDPTDVLLSPDALAQAKRVMTADGIYLVNAIAEDAEQAAPLAHALHGVFAHVYLLPCTDEEFDGSSNNLIVASDVPCSFPGLEQLPSPWCSTIL